jgi:uncharacterized repeat protein (TIGR03943 family)
MNKLFSRWLPCATLAAWSMVLLYFVMSGRLKSFLVPQFRPYVLATGIILALMALVFAFFPADAECCTVAECSHPLSRFGVGKWLTFLVLLLPISGLAMVSPNNFGKTTIENRGITTDATSLPKLSKMPAKASLDLPLPTKDGATASTAPASPASAPAAAAQSSAGTQPASAAQAPSAANDYLERTPEGYIVAEVLDLLYAAQDNVLRKDFEGKTVQLIGQLMPDTTNNASGKRFKAVRMFMTCCAADARPVAALVEASQPTKLPEMSWVKIVGTATFPIENGRRVAILKADRVEKAEPPAETMLY